jgi:hypothetical protein
MRPGFAVRACNSRELLGAAGQLADDEARAQKRDATGNQQSNIESGERKRVGAGAADRCGRGGPRCTGVTHRRCVVRQTTRTGIRKGSCGEHQHCRDEDRRKDSFHALPGVLSDSGFTLPQGYAWHARLDHIPEFSRKQHREQCFEKRGAGSVRVLCPACQSPGRTSGGGPSWLAPWQPGQAAADC